MSRALMVCRCGYDRFKVAGYNTFECQGCGAWWDITPTQRYYSGNRADRVLESGTDEAFKRLRGE